MPEMIVWPVSGSTEQRKDGSSCASRVERLPEAIHVGLGLRLDRDREHRVRELQRLEHDRLVEVAERLAGDHVLQADHGDDVAGARLVDLLALVGVHLEQAADALLAAAAGVDDLLARASTWPE